MAPERFFGAAASVSSEVYELAAVLYEMLAFILPWHPPEDPRARLQPRPLGRRGLDLPASLDGLLLCALSTRPQARPKTVGELQAGVARAFAKAEGSSLRQTVDLGHGNRTHG
jgi:hypothetical protein